MKITVLLFLSVCINSFVFSQGMITRKESVQSLYIETLKDNVSVSQGTGFIIQSKTKNYLITNWHVVTNRNPINKKWLDTNNKIEPNKIAIMHNGKTLGNYELKFEFLYDLENKKRYFEFTLGSEMVDVVAIPLIDTTEITIYPVDYNRNVDSITLRPTDILFILGFPLGTSTNPFLPIWKSGFIASEPYVEPDGKPIIWLDVNSFGGMSGSPVYFISENISFTNRRRYNIYSNKPPAFFAGIFSHSQEHVEIGALWKASFLKKIFESLP